MCEYCPAPPEVTGLPACTSDLLRDGGNRTGARSGAYATGVDLSRSTAPASDGCDIAFPGAGHLPAPAGRLRPGGGTAAARRVRRPVRPVIAPHERPLPRRPPPTRPPTTTAPAFWSGTGRGSSPADPTAGPPRGPTALTEPG